MQAGPCIKIPHSKGVEKGINERLKSEYKSIKERYFQPGKNACGCKEGIHLCQIIEEEKGLEKIKELVKNPAFICKKCGRVSWGEEYLCEAIEIEGEEG